MGVGPGYILNVCRPISSSSNPWIRHGEIWLSSISDACSLAVTMDIWWHRLEMRYQLVASDWKSHTLLCVLVRTRSQNDKTLSVGSKIARSADREQDINVRNKGGKGVKVKVHSMLVPVVS